MGDLLLGNRIKQKRTELGMTQGDIAEQIGVAVSTVQRYEKGQIDKIKLPVVEAIARVLDVDPEWLIGKTDIEKHTVEEDDELNEYLEYLKNREDGRMLFSLVNSLFVELLKKYQADKL